MISGLEGLNAFVDKAFIEACQFDYARFDDGGGVIVSCSVDPLPPVNGSSMIYFRERVEFRSGRRGVPVRCSIVSSHDLGEEGAYDESTQVARILRYVGDSLIAKKPSVPVFIEGNELRIKPAISCIFPSENA
jgi:hypothetical protein